MPIDKTKLTKEMLEMALKCKTADELIALFKKEGMEITKAEAEAYLDELQDFELDQETLDEVAGGFMPSLCHQDSSLHNRKTKLYG